MSRREERHDGIREIVRNSKVRTQQEIAAALRERGYQCTQATISRDVADIGLCKASDGTYVLGEDLALRRLVGDMVSTAEAAGNLVVVKTLPGAASGVAAAIDGASLSCIMGTVAGDDTILAVCPTPEDAETLVGTIEGMIVRG